jgi:hypothetical protein
LKPLRERGLKPRISVGQWMVGWSLPARERGLKRKSTSPNLRAGAMIGPCLYHSLFYTATSPKTLHDPAWKPVPVENHSLQPHPAPKRQQINQVGKIEMRAAEA